MDNYFCFTTAFKRIIRLYHLLCLIERLLKYFHQFKNDANAASLEWIRCTRMEATALGRSLFLM